MTLLESTSHLIDLAKTLGRDDSLTRRAVRRMEQRLGVLQLRQAKALRARRHKAWSELELVIPQHVCGYCQFEFCFGEFAKTADIDGRGHIRCFECPACNAPIIGYENPGGYMPSNNTCPANV